MKKFIIFLLITLITTAVCYSATRNSYTKYGKHMMPVYYDPYFINDLESCRKNEYVDWTGTYKYIIVGKTPKNECEYRMQYNPWLKVNKNEWQDYKVCFLNETRQNEMVNALREHSNRISSYDIGAYKTTATKVEYLLYSYEYQGACKLLWNGNK